ncbi:zinc-binding alcohol dehydrogenase family protein [Colwellia sp. D2M02]|uniref:zinc-binding alcohol dehydrogenase family protein n=1 Tax=Colwellia sp. D2M02 TaxID=2841562 RepID=UPI001C08CAEC|nr:zinc-binding alcohol dehydrogenase family protein [Colwellia sp. D2M02]MBU2892493.1 zinc-binding alcohol dehydrogenase family protein [Colwellia sp. D2M02]
MKAIGYKQPSEVLNNDALVAIELPTPTASGHDLLIEVSAISVNPVDTKVRKSALPTNDFKILGWDGVGTVKSVGEEVSLFNVGDRVFYAGDLTRDGSNAQYQLVDERIVGHAPKTLSDAQAAALPLTSITAWELLFDRLNIKQGAEEENKSLLIIGAAGGVGSILVQLAKQLTALTVVGTASRAESVKWLKDLGVDKVLDHSASLSKQVSDEQLAEFDYVISLTNSDDYLEEVAQIIKPQGKYALIDDPKHFDILLFKRKSISIHWELMFTRSLFQTDDMIAQHRLLNEISALIDEGVLQTTLGQHLGKISPENIIKAHQILESQQSRGKLVLEGF